MAQGVCSAHVISLPLTHSIFMFHPPSLLSPHGHFDTSFPSALSLPSCSRSESAGQAHFRTSGEEFGYLADPTHSTKSEVLSQSERHADLDVLVFGAVVLHEDWCKPSTDNTMCRICCWESSLITNAARGSKMVCDEEWCEDALSCHFALDLFTFGEVKVASVRRWDGMRSSGG